MTIYNHKDNADCLIMTVADYEELKGRIADALLSFFDRIEFGTYRESQNYELLIRGYRKEWVAINTFFIKDWFLISLDEFTFAMENRLSFLQTNYSKLFPETI